MNPARELKKIALDLEQSIKQGLDDAWYKRELEDKGANRVKSIIEVNNPKALFDALQEKGFGVSLNEDAVEVNWPMDRFDEVWALIDTFEGAQETHAEIIEYK